MDQDITVHPDVVVYLNKNRPLVRISEGQQCIQYLDQNNFVSDDGLLLFQSIVNALEELPNDEYSRNIKTLFIHWLQNKKKFIHLKSKRFSPIEIAKLSRDKILLNLILSTDQISKIERGNPGLEVHNINTFTNPEKDHRLKHIPCEIRLEFNKKINLQELMSPVLRDAKEIEIIDPYLPNYLALHNLKLIVDLLRQDCKIKMSVLKRDLYSARSKNRESKYIAFEEYISELIKKGFSVQISHRNIKKHAERWLLTEKYRIYLPGGLDCIKMDGTPNNKSNDGDLSYIRIEHNT